MSYKPYKPVPRGMQCPHGYHKYECRTCVDAAKFSEEYWVRMRDKAEAAKAKETVSEQPEALRLADALENDRWHISGVTAQRAADELRRLHAEVERLRYDHETEVERLTSERDAFIELNERLTADLEALRARVFVRR